MTPRSLLLSLALLPPLEARPSLSSPVLNRLDDLGITLVPSTGVLVALSLAASPAAATALPSLLSVLLAHLTLKVSDLAGLMPLTPEPLCSSGFLSIPELISKRRWQRPEGARSKPRSEAERSQGWVSAC
eukprot:766291-Hanusia_phi.AAC.2